MIKTDTQRKLKVGMIGVGGFGRRRRELMRESGRFELVAAYDRRQSALAACQREDGAQPVASYDELLAYPGLDAMMISTGATFHAEQAVAAVRRGLHCFIEKPLASTAQEIDELLRAQREMNVVIGCGHTDHRSRATSQAIKSKIDSGELGRIAAVEATTAHSGGFIIHPGDWRGDAKKNPGGMLFQCGVHVFHELMFYFGSIRRVTAVMRYDLHATATADVAMCHIEFDDGLIASVNAYHVTPYRHTMSILGTRAAVHHELGYRGKHTLWMQQVPEALDGSVEPPIPVDIGQPDGPCGALSSFYEAVTQGGVPYPSSFDGARAVAAVFAAEESARTGRTIDVRDPAGARPRETPPPEAPETRSAALRG